MSIRTKHWGLVACTLGVAFANDQYKESFDKEQSARIQALQGILARGNTAEARTLATSQITSINERLEKHGTLGPHQRFATAKFGSTLLTKEVVEHLKSFSMYTGNKISTVANNFLFQNYGIEFEFIPAKSGQPAKWVATPSRDMAKLKAFMASEMTGDSKKVWDSLSEVQKNSVATDAARQIGNDLLAILPIDGEFTPQMETSLGIKVTELEKRAEELRQDLSTAHFLDESEKRLLAAEKKVAEGLKDSKEDVSLTKFCEDMAKSITNPEDAKRRIDLMSGSDACKKPLDEQLVALKKEDVGGRGLAVEPKKPNDLPINVSDEAEHEGEEDADAEDEEKEETSKKEETEEDKENKRKALAGKAETDKKLADATKRIAEAEAKATELQQVALAAQGQAEAATQALNMQQACQQPVNLPMSGPGASQNEAVISDLSTALAKKIADNSVSMCEDGASPSKILSSMVPYGPLTAADQAKAREASENFLEVAGKLAKNRPEYEQIMAMIREEASAAALERIRVENRDLINPAVIAHLKTLSYEEMLAADASGYSPLAKGASGVNAMPLLTNTYMSYFNSALSKLKIKNKVNFDYDLRQKCAMDLATLATGRWGQEAGRSTALMGPARQAAYNSLQSMLGPTQIKNAPSSETPAKKNLREI